MRHKIDTKLTQDPTLTGKSILEEEMYQAMKAHQLDADFIFSQPKACAEVAKKYIEKAVEYVINDNITQHETFKALLIRQYQASYEKWAKENGITGSSLFPNKEVKE
jgi:succinyl-CoA synthetase alpha subunit